jgi:tetratricopeptide (TPR) repeat protein
LVHVNLPEEGETATAAFAADVFAELALRYQDQLTGRPGTIQVLDESFGRAILEELGDPDIRVEVVKELDQVKAAMRSFEAYDREEPELPSLLDDPAVTVDDVRRFADAARRFYLAEPWQHLTDQDLIVIERPKGDPRARCCVVMGNAGLQYGLAFYASADDYDDMAASPLDLDDERQYWSVTFDTPDLMPFADHDLWADHGLPLADEAHYPLAFGYGPDAAISRPTRTLLAQFEAVLSALADTTEADIDAGRWKKPWSGADGAAPVKLALPDVLDPDDVAFDNGLRIDPRANEGVQAEIGRFLRDGHFSSPEEAEEAVQKQFLGKRRKKAAGKASTPAERGQDIAYRAFDAVGRRRVILAREALAVWPDCADAYVILGEQAAGPARALPFYQQAVAAGRRALGDQAIEREAGHFWSTLETRPYMRARLGHARTLVELGRPDEAIPEYLDLLRLNPNDNQGARYLLLLQYLRANRDAEASELIARYPDDPTAEWAYSRVLLCLRSGDRPQAVAALEVARNFNSVVPEYLLDQDAEPPELDDFGVTIGGPDEAWEYVEAYGDIWDATPGALDWLRRQTRVGKKSRTKARRGKQRASGRQGGSRRR